MSEVIALLAPAGASTGLQPAAPGRTASAPQPAPVDAVAFQQAFRRAVGGRTQGSPSLLATASDVSGFLGLGADALQASPASPAGPGASLEPGVATMATALPTLGADASAGDAESAIETPALRTERPTGVPASTPAEPDRMTPAANGATSPVNGATSAAHGVDAAAQAASHGTAIASEAAARGAASAARSAHRADPAATAPTSRSFDTLDPEFRARLERVIGRAERELGFEVRVLETYRDPSRQQALFEQGRTTAGPVVTWTRNSLHSEGRATDLQLVGAAGNPAAYVRLGQIAAQEGLRTLGPRDPGHVELPRSGAIDATAGQYQPAHATSDAADANERIMAFASAAGRTVPRAQDVASYVREVARAALSGSAQAAASVSQSASVPQPARSPQAPAPNPRPSAARLPAEPTGTFAPNTTLPEPAAAGTASTKDRSERAASADAGGVQQAATPAPAPAPAPAPPADYANVAQSGLTRGANPVETVTPPASPSLDSRIERAVALQETLAARPVHSVLLRLDEAASPLAQIRVGIRGSEVMAAMDVSDPRLAGMLSAELPELQRALEKQGLDLGRADALRVLSGAAAEGNSVPRAAESFARGGGETPYRQPNGGGQRDPSGGGHPQQRSRDQQRGQKEQP